MKLTHLLAGFALIVTSSLALVAEAKLIIRGGGSSGLGGGDTVRYFADVGTPDLINDLSLITEIKSIGANKFTTQAVPYANRRDPAVSDEMRCSPEVCEYLFDVAGPFTVQGFGDTYGFSYGLTASYTWSIFEKSTEITDMYGTRTILGAEIVSFNATSSELLADGYVDVFLNTAFPDTLPLGEYEIAMTTTYFSPSDKVFGLFDKRISIGINGETFYPWFETGQQFTVETERYRLTLVTAPTLTATMLIVFGLIFVRRYCQKRYL